jgi:hypothetical protein
MYFDCAISKDVATFSNACLIGYVAEFAEVLGKQIEMIDPNGGESIIGGFIFRDGRGGSRLAKMHDSNLWKVGAKAK